MKAVVIKECRDAESGNDYAVGEVVDLSPARIKAGKEKGLLRAPRKGEIKKRESDLYGLHRDP